MNTNHNTGVRIDLGTLLTVIGVAAILICAYLIIKKISAVPGAVSKKIKGIFGKRSTIETLQKKILDLQEENDRLTLAKCQAEQELDKLRRAKAAVDDKLKTSEAKLFDIETDMDAMKKENDRLIEYCKDLRHRIDIGERAARREGLETAWGLVKLGVDKSISLLQSSVTGSWDRIQTEVVKLNAIVAEEIRKLPSPQTSVKEREDFDPYKDEWK